MENILATMEFDLWDGRWIKNFTGDNTKGKLTFKEQTFSIRASCFCERYYELEDSWHKDEAYIWRGEYRKTSVVAVELLAKNNDSFQIVISVNGCSDDVVLVFPNIKEANKFYRAFLYWLEWDKN